MRNVFAALALLASFSVGVTSLEAQTYSLTVSGPAQVGEGAAFDASLNLDFTGDPMAGFSYGVCNDPAFVTLAGRADGAAIGALNGGDGPDFNEVASFAGGYTVGLVICFTGCNPLPAGSGLELAIGSYTGDAETASTQIATCDTLGTPPVATVVVVNGASIAPDQFPLDLEIVGVPDPAFTYIASDATVSVSSLPASFSVGITIDQDDNGAPDAETQGFSMGLTSDPALLEVTDVQVTLPFAPDFAEIGTSDPTGWTAGLVYSFTGAITAVLQSEEVISASYQTAGGASPMVGSTTPLAWGDTVGTPPVANVVVVGGASLAAAFDDGVVSFIEDPEFRRADTNADGLFNIADGIWLLNDLFQGGPTTRTDCAAANDCNGDDAIDAADAIYVFMTALLDGPLPPAPFPDCGPEANPAATLDCPAYGGGC